MRVDNDGEGGILALGAARSKASAAANSRRGWLAGRSSHLSRWGNQACYFGSLSAGRFEDRDAYCRAVHPFRERSRFCRRCSQCSLMPRPYRRFKRSAPAADSERIAAYYNTSGTHCSWDNDTPVPRPVQRIGYICVACAGRRTSSPIRPSLSYWHTHGTEVMKVVLSEFGDSDIRIATTASP
jgi:hypothetical protein